MSKHFRSYFYLYCIVIGTGLLVVWFMLPTILRAIPSRYVVRLPAPLQAIGQRDHVEILPTADVQEALIAQILPTTLPTVAPTLAPVTIVEVSTAAPTPTLRDTSAITSADESPVESPTPLPTSTPLPTPTITPTPSPTSIPFSPSARIGGIQHQFQGWNNCGPATLAMALSHFDLYLPQEETAAWLKPNPEDRNVSPHELVGYVEEQTPYSGIERVNGDLDTLKRLVDNKIPVIIETGIDPPGTFSWMEWYGHYYLVVAYDDASQTMWVYDSWLGTGEGEDGLRINEREGRPISYEEFDFHWRQFIRQYVAIYPEDKEGLVHDIIGPENLDDQMMWTKALEQARLELNQDEENAYLWFNIGTIYTKLGDYEIAAAAYDQARQIGLPWRMLWYQFGPYEAYMQIGRYEDVVELADVTLRNRPYFEESFYYRGRAQIALGEQSAGIRDLERAIDFNPRYQPARDALDKLN